MVLVLCGVVWFGVGVGAGVVVVWCDVVWIVLVWLWCGCGRREAVVAGGRLLYSGGRL